ncbi:ornithine carbamoyltransferase [uncultured Finegoldia sp.]|uniref:ornithine carbamoyltransferase n=1 Tax=uncultured Finegoldia sp. TaxID=328009 RepID=UPI0026068F7E|nr:ornithine carbamoyltransferase [uncultured Finegoldia sp.]
MIKGRDFLTLKDFTKEEIEHLLNVSAALKEKKRMGIVGETLKGKNIVLLFEKTSTRTRCSFETACHDEGGNVTFLGMNDSQFGKKESVRDSALVLSRFYDGIEFRGFDHATVEELAKYSSVPVWNGLTDVYHPTQILADFLTVKENIHKNLDQVKFVYIGDGRNNMANSLMIGAAKIGMEFVNLAPKELHPSNEMMNTIQEIAKESGAKITVTDDFTNLKGADVIYTDVWVSMGEEDQFEERINLLKDYQVDMKKIEMTENPNVIFLHCLPSFHNLETKVGREIYEKFGLSEMEVTDEVFYSKYSKVFDEAENRMHTIKAVIVETIGNK